MKPKTTYLDYAAATPLDEDVRAAMHEVEDMFANPSAQYASARESHSILEQARTDVAASLGCKAAEIVFTSGGTESENLALFGLADLIAQTTKKPGRIVSVRTEHSAILEPLARLENRGWQIDFCPVDQFGVVDLVALEKLIKPTTTIITIGVASSEIGTIQPIAKIAQIINKIRTKRGRAALPLFLHSDASAGVESIPVHVHRLGVDTLSINAAKIYGPKGAAALFVRRGIDLPAQILGGSQENGYRAGTENIAGAVGLAAALNKTTQLRSAEAKRQTKLRDELLAQLRKDHPKLVLNGHAKHRLANNLNISLPGFDGETLVTYLDAEGIELATGAACNAASHEPSSTILALGKSPEDAQSSLRISLGRATTSAEIKHFVRCLKTITEKLATISL